MNSGEAERCCDIARAALEGATSASDLDKANRFLDKALRLDSTCARAETLRGEVEARRAKGFDASASASSAKAGEEGERTTGGGGESHRASAKTTTSGSAKSGGKRGTPEQEKLIAKIKKAGADYYEVLGVAKGSSEADIKKAYRKLALKLHPDKCQADGAEEVFKTVSRAFACLSDPNKRAAFDRYGSEDPQQAGFGPGMRRRGGAGAQGFGFEDDIDPADIFNMFFNGGMPGGFGGPGFRVHTFGGSPFGGHPFGGHPFGHRQRRRRHAGASDPRVDDTATVIRNILHLAPLLIPLIMWLFTPMERDFALTRSKEHPHVMKTERMDLSFYANRGEFNRKFAAPSQRKAMEKRIENEIITQHRYQCDYERQSWTSKRHSCEYLRELQSKHPSLNIYSAW